MELFLTKKKGKKENNKTIYIVSVTKVANLSLQKVCAMKIDKNVSHSPPPLFFFASLFKKKTTKNVKK